MARLYTRQAMERAAQAGPLASTQSIGSDGDAGTCLPLAAQYSVKHRPPSGLLPR
jgi:hypothetical protein